MRLLITGTRSTNKVDKVRHALASWRLRENGLYLNIPVTLVHGACPHPKKSEYVSRKYFSVDLVAHDFALENGWDVEPHPAHWYEHDENCNHRIYADGFCPAAGPRRNKEMVKTLDPITDYVIGFPQGVSTGTRGCLGLALKLKQGIKIATIEL